MDHEIFQMDLDQHRLQLRELLGEYLRWANSNLGRSYGVEVDVGAMLADTMAKLDAFMPPHGSMLLVRAGDALAGCAGLTGDGGEAVEVKRMYVRPEHRRKGLGKALLEALIAQARALGYARIRLDSAGFMSQAHALYRAAGFTPIEPYAESEIPSSLWEHWVFMELDLRRS